MLLMSDYILTSSSSSSLFQTSLILLILPLSKRIAFFIYYNFTQDYSKDWMSARKQSIGKRLKSVFLLTTVMMKSTRDLLCHCVKWEKFHCLRWRIISRLGSGLDTINAIRLVKRLRSEELVVLWLLNLVRSHQSLTQLWRRLKRINDFYCFYRLYISINNNRYLWYKKRGKNSNI